MEIFDLYTKDRVKTGDTILRGTKVPDGKYRLVVHIAVFNDKGEMLIQHRAKDKDKYPNLWDFSAGGSVVAGENSSQGASRELFEEIGIKHNFSDTIPSFSVNFESGFGNFYIFYTDLDISDLVFQKEEVQDAKWASKEEILNMLLSGEFVPFRKELIELVFSFFNIQFGTLDKE